MHDVTVEHLIEENNRLREELNDENKVYYEKILLYLRIKSIFKDDMEIETILLGLLRDLLEAQSHGENASDYFGKDAKEMCEGLLEQTSRSKVKDVIKFILIGFIAYAVSSQMFEITKPTLTLNIGQLTSGLFAAVLAIWLILYLVKCFVFRKTKENKLMDKVSMMMLYAVAGVIFTAAMCVPIFVLKDVFLVTIPAPYDLLFIIGLAVACLLAAYVYKIEWLRDLMPYISLMICLSIAVRTPLGKEILVNFKGKDLKSVIAILAMSALIFLMLYIPVLKMNKRKK
ncbi:hypothetical protein [Pseudolactococcus carnosus]|uniref:Integral membrane protein n=1 Tax=Pseudolactococcus carnosus TaxID=2749961 RepID=A0ABT0AR99_9LACT|nr:hypothetical protein [Lactococcus carnosus]MCJ1989233.1 hypothetical protein [Lactococcus carnosus]